MHGSHKGGLGLGLGLEGGREGGRETCSLPLSTARVVVSSSSARAEAGLVMTSAGRRRFFWFGWM